MNRRGFLRLVLGAVGLAVQVGVPRGVAAPAVALLTKQTQAAFVSEEPKYTLAA